MPLNHEGLAAAQSEMLRWVKRSKKTRTLNEENFVEASTTALDFADHVMDRKASPVEVKAMALRLARKFLEIADT